MKAVMGEFLLTINSKKRLRLAVMATPMVVELMGEEVK